MGIHQVADWQAHDHYVLGLVFARDGQWLASCGMDRQIHLWDTAAWQLQRTLAGHTRSVNGLALTPKGDVLASISTDGTLRLWSFPEGQPLHALQDRKKTVSCVGISADGGWVVAGSYGGRVAIWTLAGQPVSAFSASRGNLSTAALSPDGATLVTGGLGEAVCLWAPLDGAALGALEGHRTAVLGAWFTEDGATLLTLGYEGQLLFWDTATWERVRSETLAEGTRGAALSPDGRWLALLQPGQVRVREMATWELRAELEVGTPVASALAWSPAGDLLAVGAADRRVRVWALD